jgi:hypothetical protein
LTSNASGTSIGVSEVKFALDAGAVLEIKKEKNETRKFPDQKELGRATGLPENSTCLVSSWAYLYMTDNPGASLDSVYEIVKNQKGVSIDAKSSTVTSMPSLSKALADGLGNSKYGEDIFQFPFLYNEETKTRDQVVFGTKEELYKSDEKYRYAIAEYNQKTADGKIKTHFTFIDRNTETEIDPWPGGISATWDSGTYRLKSVKPVGLYK